MINIMIADENLDFATKLMNYINEKISSARVCNLSTTNQQAIFSLNNNNIDIAILGLKDNASVLNKISNSLKYKFSCILLSDTEIPQSDLVFAVFDRSSSFDKIVFSINTILNYKENEKITAKGRKAIANELSYLGYNFSHIGTSYLLDVIVYIYENPDKEYNNLSRDVYPIICERLNEKVDNMKSYIARETKEMYFCCPIDRLQDYFHFVDDTKPNVKTVINTIINKLR